MCDGDLRREFLDAGVSRRARRSRPRKGRPLNLSATVQDAVAAGELWRRRGVASCRLRDCDQNGENDPL